MARTDTSDDGEATNPEFEFVRRIDKLFPQYRVVGRGLGLALIAWAVLLDPGR